MADRLEIALEQGIRELGLGLPANAQTKFLHYLHLLTKWNKTFNLSGVTAINEMVPLHLLDSLAVLPHISGKRIIDIGSGAGLPGIPLAIASPETQFVLLDSNGKKTRFLFQAKLALELDNVEIVNARVDDYLATESAGQFSQITCRAFATLKDIVEMSEGLLAQGTDLLAMKGVYPTAEIDELPSTLVVRQVTELFVPGVDSKRHLVLVGLGNSANANSTGGLDQKAIGKKTPNKETHCKETHCDE